MAEYPETLKREMIGWRHGLHARPEFGFEEKHNAVFVAAKLREFGGLGAFAQFQPRLHR